MRYAESRAALPSRALLGVAAHPVRSLHASPTMKITLLSDDAIRLEPVPGPLTIEAPTADTQYSPFHMLGSSLASCTFSVLYSWATHAKLPVDDLRIEVRWQFGDDPHRVSDIALTFDWPSLPQNRRSAAQRVAELCTVHATLTYPPHITIAAAAGTSTSEREHSPDHHPERRHDHQNREPTGAGA